MYFPERLETRGACDGSEAIRRFPLASRLAYRPGQYSVADQSVDLGVFFDSVNWMKLGGRLNLTPPISLPKSAPWLPGPTNLSRFSVSRGHDPFQRAWLNNRRHSSARLMISSARRSTMGPASPLSRARRWRRSHRADVPPCCESGRSPHPGQDALPVPVFTTDADRSGEAGIRRRPSSKASSCECRVRRKAKRLRRHRAAPSGPSVRNLGQLHRARDIWRYNRP